MFSYSTKVLLHLWTLFQSLIKLNTMTEENTRDCLEQLQAPMILLGDFNAHNPLWGSEKMSTRGRILENILDRFNLLCLNEKEETYYRAYDGKKSTIDLTLTSTTIAPEYRWSKEYKLRGSDHFPIILEDEREFSIKQQQRWSIGRANWTQFQKKKTLTRKYRTKTQPKNQIAA